MVRLFFNQRGRQRQRARTAGLGRRFAAVTNQNAVEVVQFVLDDPRPQARCAKANLAAADVVTAHLDPLGSRDADLDIRQAEATFHEFSWLAGLVNLCIGQTELPALDRAHEHALFKGYLRSSQSNARVRLHQGKHFLHKIR